MSGFINSLLIEPVVRQARRFSNSAQDWTSSPPPSLPGTGDEAHDSSLDPNPLSRARSGDAILPDRTAVTSALTDAQLRDVWLGAAPDDHVLEPLLDSGAIDIQGYPREPSTISGSLEESEGSDRLTPSEPTRNDTQHSSSSQSGGARSRRVSVNSARSRSNFDLPLRRGSEEQGSTRSRQGSVADMALSKRIPDDDGMKPLREKMKLIRDMALSSEEKASRMHALMIADYQALRNAAELSEGGSKRNSDSLSVGVKHSRVPSSGELSHRSPTPVSTTSTGDGDDLLAVSSEDLKLTYQIGYRTGGAQSAIGSRSSVDDDEEDVAPLGCTHYQRNVKIQCGECKRWYTCRHCHDAIESHPLDRKGIKNMLCMLCGHAQKAGEYCAECGALSAAYYCSICQLWENDPNKKIYHCPDCGICRRGEGLGKDFVHCKKCNVCISIAWIAGHKCVERATECDCPICNDWLFSSSLSVVAMQCGHYIHRKCYDDYMQRSYKCPICNRSAVNMELQWRKLDAAIFAQPMPSQFSDTKAWITCNDCAARTCTSYHWLGNKCTVCDSYNTNYIKLINTPVDQEMEGIRSSQEAQALRAAEQSVGNAAEHAATAASQAATASVRHSSTTPGTTAEFQTVGSTDSPATLQDTQAASSTFHPSTQEQPHSPAATGTTVVGSPRSPEFRGSDERENEADEEHSPVIVERPRERQDRNGNDDFDDDEDDDEEDDVGFWGEPISPGSWNIPMGISPMSGWTSPSFFATRMEARNGERAAGSAGGGEANGTEGNEEEDEEEDDGEWSTDSSDEEEEEQADLDEDGDVEEIELFGHR